MNGPTFPRAWPFAAAAFAGSFLLFTLELVAARLLLPSFGGAAYVWTGSMMAFQGLLLAGYLYAEWALRRSARWHLAVLASPLAVLPLSMAVPAGGPPLARLLGALLRSIGLPFFALAATSTVLQGWLRRLRPGDEDTAYALYAASNAGSLAALLLYPAALEPRLTLGWQCRLWAGLYAVFAASHALLLPASKGERAPAAPLPPAAEQACWVLLALAPSAALLAATNLLTLDFAAVPLLWILPLALYLLTFVLNFKRRPWYPRRLSTALAAAFGAWAAAVAVTAARSADLAQRWQVLRRLWVVNKLLFVCAALFLLCLICHRALAQKRPAGEAASRYYALIALGGWLGGLLIAVLMPLAARRLALPELDAALAGALAVASLLYAGWAERRQLAALTLVGAAGLALYVRQSPAFEPGTRYSLRNFYGYYRVVDKDGFRRFFHGNTLHGVQSLDPARRREPLLYFGSESPIADVMAARPRKVGIVGLGAGVLAAYGRPGMAIDYYELDPDVIDVARRWFTYLGDSAARVTVTPGDARLSLERAEGGYDVLVLDAFTAGAIPVHTMTREAFRLYGDRLAPGGVVAVHVTNRFLNLRPALAALARAEGWHAAARQTGLARLREQRFFSSWVVLSRDAAAVRRLRDLGWEGLDHEPPVRAWTDDYASVLSAFRR